MNNQNGDYYNMQVLCVLGGILTGILCFFIYQNIPSQRTALVIFGVMAGVLVLLYGVRRNCCKHYEKAIAMAIKMIQNGREGNVAFIGHQNEPQAINELLEEMEAFRQNLRKKEILQTAAMDITNSMAHNLEFYKLIDVLMNRLVEEMDANWGVFYLYHELAERLELKKALGLSKKVYQEFDVLLGEGLIGIAAQTGKIEVYDNIPNDVSFENRTFLGDITPKNIMAIPVKCQDKLIAVLGFGTIYEFTKEQLQLMQLLQYPMGFAVANSLAYEKTQNFSKELKMQNQLFQSINVEMSKKMAMRTESSTEEDVSTLQ